MKKGKGERKEKVKDCSCNSEGKEGTRPPARPAHTPGGQEANQGRAKPGQLGSMPPPCQLGCPFLLLQLQLLLQLLAALSGEGRSLQAPAPLGTPQHNPAPPLQLRDAAVDLSAGGLPYQRPLRCIDMLSVEGRFTLNAAQPQLNCAAFFISEPQELITIHFDLVSIDCRAGDFLKVFDGWILKGEKFPSAEDHPLPMSERYIDLCENNVGRSINSSQNVAMIFFRIHKPGNGFTVSIRKIWSLFPCNVISQTPSGGFTMVIPHQHRNCSFSIIYPVVMQITNLTLGSFSHLQLKGPSAGCGRAGDFVELLGGTSLDPSKMKLLTDVCYPFQRPVQMKIGCDNVVLRLVSSGKHVNQVTFEYHQLAPNDLATQQGSSTMEFCFPGT
ncbi:corticotropin-releasing factor-binding protein [Tachyglossus aculeatus]|uniref:corticotropin-releasing factor-binding protein n=1 Tax=Tachyglossus aculeatus TaxID=9261 RepID=UPI0018F79866|nr:corticotropin-releasing factor-binding protein [Tachyglossus aculeatus]